MFNFIHLKVTFIVYYSMCVILDLNISTGDFGVGVDIKLGHRREGAPECGRGADPPGHESSGASHNETDQGVPQVGL